MNRQEMRQMRHRYVHVLGQPLLLLAAALGSSGQAFAEEAEGPRTGEEAILAALEEETSFDFINEPLLEVLQHFKARHNIEIQTDREVFSGLGGIDNPVTKRLSNVTLCSALNLILREIDLTWMIADDVLVVTSSEVAELQLTTKVYDVAKMVDADGQHDHRWRIDALGSVISGTVESGTWENVGGPGSLTGFAYQGASVLIVRQTHDVHAKVAGFLDELTRIVERRDDQRARTAEDAILAALEERTSVDFVNEPLQDVADHLQCEHKIQIQIDFCALEDVNMGADVPVTRKV